MKIETEICNLARGLAILCIVIHNFVHIIPDRFVPENEMTFYPGLIDCLLEKIMALDFSVVGDAFSHFGWYGVAVFVFLSGAGLAEKYEGERAVPFHCPRYIVRSLVKLLLLSVPVYISYLFSCRILGYERCVRGLSSFPMVGNMVYPFDFPEPGVYWYLGLAMQLYILYAIYRRFSGVGVLAVTTGLIAIVFVGIDPMFDPVQERLAYLRGNCVYWIPLFLAGILVVRRGFLIKWNYSALGLVMTTVFSFALVVASAFEYHLWLLSVFPAVMFYLGLAKLLRLAVHFPWVRIVMFVGSCSGGIFVAHPLVRLYFQSRFPTTNVEVLIWTLSGLIVSILLGFGYSLVYRWLRHKFELLAI